MNYQVSLFYIGDNNPITLCRIEQGTTTIIEILDSNRKQAMVRALRHAGFTKENGAWMRNGAPATIQPKGV